MAGRWGCHLIHEIVKFCLVHHVVFVLVHSAKELITFNFCPTFLLPEPSSHFLAGDFPVWHALHIFEFKPGQSVSVLALVREGSRGKRDCVGGVCVYALR